ncbi:MAG: alpha/beta fold hydrolase [Magnetococcales bacterium]|nr:alpha/beta fold hydrolase [Magnetococcales bacterium]
MGASIFSLFLLGYLGVCAYLYLMQEEKVFVPKTRMEETPAQWGLDYADVHLTSEGLRLHGWWLPGKTETPVILFLHGNATNVARQPEFALWFHQVGWPTLMIDYRGYGKSEGQPSEAGLYADALTAWDYLVQEKGIPAEKIIIYGHSLGTGVASWLATRREPGGVLLEGGFTSVPDRAAEIYPLLPVRWLSHIDFGNRSRVAQIRAPLLVVHSREDTVIPFHHGEQLFAAANSTQKMFLEIVGEHKYAFARWPGSVDAMHTFGKVVVERGSHKNHQPGR